jgi:ribosomal protein L7/L12
MAMGEATAFLSILILVLFLLIAMLTGRLIKMEKRLAKLIPIDAKLDLLLKAARPEYDPLAQLPSEVVKALQAGQKIKAIKHYREATSVSLAEAKSVIEEAQRRAGLGF